MADVSQHPPELLDTWPHGIVRRQAWSLRTDLLRPVCGVDLECFSYAL